MLEFLERLLNEINIVEKIHGNSPICRKRIRIRDNCHSSIKTRKEEKYMTA